MKINHYNLWIEMRVTKITILTHKIRSIHSEPALAQGSFSNTQHSLRRYHELYIFSRKVLVFSFHSLFHKTITYLTMFIFN